VRRFRHNDVVSFFGIAGYEPQWRPGRTADPSRLRTLNGRRLDHAWLLWDLDAGEWWPDGPVLLDFEGEQVEITHAKFDDLSITWNTVDPAGQPSWDWEPPRLGWRRDVRPELSALEGQRLIGAELLQWSDRSMANGMVAPSFAFPGGRVTVSNGMDENLLEFGDPDPAYRRL